LRRLAVAGLAVVLLALTISAQTVTSPVYDVVIRNGHVLDGAGNPAIRADVAIKGGRFVRIGIVTGRGRQEIDAAGKYVSPGWIGLTTALIYPPSSFATTPELIEVAKSAAKYGGIYASHIRGEGKEVVASVDEAIEIGEKGGLPVEIFHLKVAHGPGWGTLMHEVGRHVEQARARGV